MEREVLTPRGRLFREGTSTGTCHPLKVVSVPVRMHSRHGAEKGKMIHSSKLSPESLALGRKCPFSGSERGT